MTVNTFLFKCEQLFRSKAVSGLQTIVYHDKMARFTGEEIDAIFSACVERCRFFPTVAEIYEIGGEMNIGGLSGRKDLRGIDAPGYYDGLKDLE